MVSPGWTVRRRGLLPGDGAGRLLAVVVRLLIQGHAVLPGPLLGRLDVFPKETGQRRSRGDFDGHCSVCGQVVPAPGLVPTTDPTGKLEPTGWVTPTRCTVAAPPWLAGWSCCTLGTTEVKGRWRRQARCRALRHPARRAGAEDLALRHGVAWRLGAVLDREALCGQGRGGDRHRVAGHHRHLCVASGGQPPAAQAEPAPSAITSTMTRSLG